MFLDFLKFEHQNCAVLLCLKLYEELSTAECDSCGDYGGYLYLVTCRRVCFLCLTENPDYLPILRADAIRKFGLGPDGLKGLGMYLS